MRLRVVSLIALLASPLIAQVSAPPSATVEGQVVNSTTGAPLSLARLKLQRQAGEPIYLKVDSEGKFLSRNLQPATYQLTVQSPGFL